MAFRFEGLDVWQEAQGYAHELFQLTLAFHSKYNAVSQQLQRAALSVPLNIAEGAGRKTRADFRRILTIAQGSLSESVSLLKFAHGEKLLGDEAYEVFYERATKIARMLTALYNSLTDH